MRARELILNGSVCEGSFDGTASTQAEYVGEDHSQCRFFPNDCPVVRGVGGPHCIPRAAHEVARYVIKDYSGIEAELDDFMREYPIPQRGMFDPTRQETDAATTDRAAIRENMTVWVNHILGIQPVDSASLNNEYKAAASAALLEEYPVLGESVYDDTQAVWIHSCGSILQIADVIHQVRYKAMPLAGPGRVEHEAVPYCGTCGDTPNTQGHDLYVEDQERDEAAFLKRLGGDR